MSDNAHLKRLNDAYRHLSAPAQKIVDQKTYAGVFSPDEIIDTLLTLKPYTEAVEKSKRLESRKQKQGGVWKLRLGQGFVAVFVLVIVYMLVPSIWLFALGFMVITVLIWGGWRVFVKTSLEKKWIHTQTLDFTLNLVALLKDEIRPGSQLDFELNLDNPKRKKYRYKTDKNYLVLGHRVVMGLFWLILFTGLPYIYINLFTNKALFWTLLALIIMLFFFLLFIFHAIASAVFGESPKVKKHLSRTSQLTIKTPLIDGTVFQVEVLYLMSLAKLIKKKVKVKNFQLSKTKKKHKVKMVVGLKMAFPTKKYRMTEQSFKEEFNRNWSIRNRKVDKVKLKPGQKKNTVVYQDVQSTQGQGYKDINYPEPDIHRFLELVTRGGFRALQQSLHKKVVETDTKNEEDTITTDEGQNTITIVGDDLTKIKGIVKKTQEGLHRVGITTYEQLAKLDKKGIREVMHELATPHWQVERWQVAAQEIVDSLPSSSSDDPAQDNLTKINGIGRSTADNLNKWGVYTYKQMAEMSEDDFADILQRINSFPDKAAEWQAQARAFIENKREQK